jgi:hypothetical protein
MKSAKTAHPKKEDYKQIILTIFNNHYEPGTERFSFARSELLAAAAKLGLKLESGENDDSATSNVGDVVYTYRFRREFPKEILSTAPQGKMWIITGRGDGLYEFRLIMTPNLNADPSVFITKVHDATPEIVRRFALNDEQQFWLAYGTTASLIYFASASPSRSRIISGQR